MGTWQTLFRLEVEHGYFPDGVCRDLRLEPTAATQNLLHKTGCLLRPTGNGVLVAFDGHLRNALERQAQDEAAPLVFRFLGRGPDPSFANYTEGAVGSQQVLLAFDNEDAGPDGDDGLRTLSGQVRPLHTLAAEGWMSTTEVRVPPHFVAGLRIGPDALSAPRRFVCRFEARATVWKYCLCGELAEQADALRVIDLGQSLRFESAVDERLPDGRAMRAVRSSAPIALQQRSTQRFQLRSESAGADKVLIRRLPVASPSQLNRETLGGVLTWVSEIYVHR